MSLFIRLQCQRCFCVFALEPGESITEYCETCIRILGRRIHEDAQTGLNRRTAYCREQFNRAPWGNELHDPLRAFSLPVKKP